MKQRLERRTNVYPINEIFDSIQGEGFWMGMPATFIRLQGCPVGCEWCDSGPLADEIFGRHTNGLTRNTWGKGGEFMQAQEIVNEVHHPHVVITGGEPTIFNLDPLIEALIMRLPPERMIQMETSGFSKLKGDTHPDWITWSPKERLGYAAHEDLKSIASEVKWVVDDRLKWETVYSTFRWYKEKFLYPYFFLMPEGSPPRQETVLKALSWLREHDGSIWKHTLMYSDRLQYRLGIR